MMNNFFKKPQVHIIRTHIKTLKDEITACPIFKKFKENQKRNIYILLITLMFLVLYVFFGRDKILYDGNKLSRATVGGNNKIYNFYGIIDNKKFDISAIVSPKRYSVDEANNLFKKCFDEILINALGENDDYFNIRFDLDLKSDLGQGITAEWRFIPDEKDSTLYYKYLTLIDKYGKVYNNNLSENDVVSGSLEVQFSTLVSGIDEKYKSNKFVIPIKIKKRLIDSFESVKLKLFDEISSIDKSSQGLESLVLPKKIDGFIINYREKFDYTILIIVAFGISLIFLFTYRDKYNVEKEEKNLKKGLILDYPQLITKSLLYIGAGMSIRNALIRIADNYNKNVRDTKTVRILPTKLEKMKMKLVNGISEVVALEELSKEIDDRNYTRFFNILIQNIKNGNKDLKMILEIEMGDALYERKMNAKRLAEEASTKLVLPLMLIFGIIMAVIIIPAFMNM